MERINATDLKGSSAYFTNFDNRIVNNTLNLDVLKKNAERTLKVLLLTKNNVVCAASHLVNQVAYEIFSENKILLEEELIIPAFVESKEEISELFEKRNKKKKDILIPFYEDNLKKTVLWNLADNATWFRDNFVKGLLTEKSVIRNNLVSLTDEQIIDIATQVKGQTVFSRNFIDELSEGFDMDTKRILKNYRELIYHMSGARVCNCESTLPQENYIDYSLADFDQRKTMLSDTQIFCKYFVELLFETLNKYPIPVNVLDLLSFEDISKIRQPIQDSNFIEDYQAIYRTAFYALDKENESDFLYSIKDLMELRDNLEKGFQMVFEKEIPNYLKSKRAGAFADIVKNFLRGLLFLTFSRRPSELREVR